MAVKLERVSARQKDALRRLLDDYLHEFAALEGVPASTDAKGHVPYKCFDAYWTEDGRVPLSIVADGKPAGFCLLRETANEWEIAEFYVMPPFRRQRVGAEAVRQLLEFCRTRDQTHLVARVKRWNQPALTFWRGQGFQVLGEEGEDLITSHALLRKT
jgi:predicted acetyltransferase